MPTDRRRDAATATVGAGMLAGGGKLRHLGVKQAVAGGPFPTVHVTALARKGAKGRRLYGAGTALGALGLAPFAMGTTNLVRREVTKADERRSFWREGLGGTAQALRGRTESLATPQPKDVRATQLGVAAGAGGLGSVATRVLLGRRGDVVKPFAGPLGGALAATGSVPLTNKAIQRKHPDYVVTSTGVKRRKTDPVKPSARASVVDARKGSLRSQIVPSDVRKADSYLGSRTSYGTQRAAVTAAGHPPIVGPLTAAAAAGKYAPPGQERKHAARQYVLGSGLGVGTGIAGAYGGARMADNSARVARGAAQFNSWREGAENKVRRAVGMGTKKPFDPAAAQHTRIGRLKLRTLNSRAAKPLLKSPAAAAGAAAGFFGVKAATGAIGGQTAISLNQRDQTRYNFQHGISKAMPRTAFALKDIGHDLQHVGVGRVLNAGSEVVSFRKVPAARYKKDGTVTARHAKPSNLQALHDGLVASRNKDPMTGGARDIVEGIAMFKTGKYLRNAGQKLDLQPSRQERLARALNARHGVKTTQRSTRGGFLLGGRPERIAKAATSKEERKDLANKKRLSAALSAAGGTAGLTGVGLLLRRKKEAATTAGIIGGGFGGTNALLNTPIQRSEAKAIDPGKIRKGGGIPIVKADALELRNDRKTNQQLIGRYGDRGPLPKGIDRSEKMRAYEARYVHHGGHKANKYARRAEIGEGVKNIGLGVATAGGAGWLASRTKRGAKAAAKISPRTRHHMDTLAVGGGVAGGAGEIYSGYANHRQSSYANTPGGVAASALRRMRAYTPPED